MVDFTNNKEINAFQESLQQEFATITQEVQDTILGELQDQLGKQSQTILDSLKDTLRQQSGRTIQQSQNELINTLAGTFPTALTQGILGQLGNQGLNSFFQGAAARPSASQIFSDLANAININQSRNL